MLVMHGAGCAVAPIAAGSLMAAVGSHGLPLYIACVFTLLGLYAIYRRRHVTALITHTAHFEPMILSAIYSMIRVFMKRTSASVWLGFLSYPISDKEWLL
ncbi:hypothetical protein [Vreelandella maris]|nr:hypothetical protein [Halomonas maris]